MVEPVVSTPQSQLNYIEGQANFFERNLNHKNRAGMSTTTILGSVMILLIRSLVATAKELKRLNDREDKNGKVLLG